MSNVRAVHHTASYFVASIQSYDGSFLCTAANKDVLPAFDDFMYKNIVPACFAAPLKTTFDLNDAQTVLVSHLCVHVCHSYKLMQTLK